MNKSNLSLNLLIIFSLTSYIISIKDTFSPIDSDLFNNIQCVPHAYGDFNADKRVDIICVTKSGDQIEIWLAQEKEPLFSRFQILNVGSPIVNIVPGDFTGDSAMDLLVTYNKNDSYKMSFYQGQRTAKYHNEAGLEKKIELNLLDQPFVVDFDGDGKLDVLLTFKDLNTKFFSFNSTGDLFEMSFVHLDNTVKLKNGFAHTITDVNGDFKSDLVLVGHGGNNQRILFFVLEFNSFTKTYEKSDSYLAPDGSYVYGQSLFGDFDSDGEIEHLLPSCNDKECSKSFIFIRKLNKWNQIPIDFGNYRFIPPDSFKTYWGNSISVKSGDYNLNGFLDLMLVLESEDKKAKTKEKYAVLMKNIPNSVLNASTTFNRTFEMDHHISSLYSYNNVVQASFFDLYDDGYLDILLVIEEDDGVNYRIVALKNDYYDDVYFIKVMVIPGLCSQAMCPFQSIPYGLNYPGALVKIESISNEYQRVIMYATQLSQSSYMSLQLPYIIFGLGPTPNFVEHLTVGISTENGKNTKEWHQIIPNSQLVINPYPRHNTYNWKMQLFITPSKNILMTGIALGSTMIILIIMIGLLQFREKKMDEKERKIESQRFHFDGL